MSCVPDSFQRQIRTIAALSALPSGGTVRTPQYGWIEFGGVHSGWFISFDPNGTDAAVEIGPGGAMPAPPGGVLHIVTAGTGTLKLNHMSEEVGAILLQGRGTGGATNQAGVIATTTSRGKVEDSWSSVDSISVINMANAGTSTLYTCPQGKVARIFLHGFVATFGGAGTLQLDRSGGVFDQYTTAAVGNLFRNLGPINLTGLATLRSTNTALGVGNTSITMCIEERFSE